MSKPSHHIFVCGSYRQTGAAGVCHKKEAAHILQHLTMEAQDRGLDDVMISSTGCMNLCESGPVLVVLTAGTIGGVGASGATICPCTRSQSSSSLRRVAT